MSEIGRERERDPLLQNENGMKTTDNVMLPKSMTISTYVKCALNIVQFRFVGFRNDGRK